MTQRALSKHSESTQKALRQYLKSNQREREQSDFVIPSEPKMLRLVKIIITHGTCPCRGHRLLGGEDGDRDEDHPRPGPPVLHQELLQHHVPELAALYLVALLHQGSVR